jgi:hypothetical protein
MTKKIGAFHDFGESRYASLGCTIRLPTEWTHCAKVSQLTVKAGNSNANLARRTSESWSYRYLVGCLTEIGRSVRECVCVCWRLGVGGGGIPA